MKDKDLLSDSELIGVNGGIKDQRRSEAFDDEEDGLFPKVKYCWPHVACPLKYWEKGATDKEKKAACKSHHCVCDPDMGKLWCSLK